MTRDRTSGEKTPERSVSFTPADRLCAWMTEGRRCTMLGEGSLRIGDEATRYCAWHLLMLESPRWADDFQEFERYCLAGRGRYCGQWTHYPPTLLWDCVRGLGTYTREKPGWCGRVDCRHFDIRDIVRWMREKPVEVPASRRDGRALAGAVARELNPTSLAPHTAKPAEQQKAELQDWMKRHEAKQDGEAT